MKCLTDVGIEEEEEEEDVGNHVRKEPVPYCERDLHVGAPLMSIRHLLHCKICPSACSSLITSLLGGYSNSSSAKIVYTVSTSITTQSS
jgi:hypothetical protein